MVLGVHLPVRSEPFKSRLISLGRRAARFRHGFAPASGLLWPDLVYADHGRAESSAVTHSFRRLLVMALAWAQPGTGLTRDADLLSVILRGVDQLQRDVYHASGEPYGNWWNWKVGIPEVLMDLCALLHDELGPRRIAGLVAANDHFVPNSAIASYRYSSTGANRISQCRSVVFSGVFGKSAARLSRACESLSPVFSLVTSGDGFYADGSFIQHRSIPYTGTYGAVLIDGVARLSALLAGSKWAIKHDEFQLFLANVDRSFAPCIFHGLVMDGVSGRAVSRASDDHRRGHTIMDSILLLADSAPAADRARWMAMVKGWIERDEYSPVWSDSTLSMAGLARFKSLADDQTIAAAPEPETDHRVFAAMDRIVHRRPTWAASVSMSSIRTSFYETGNGENLRGWHANSGMLYWWAASAPNGSVHPGLGQYSDGFWPTVDPYRLPGTTVSRKPLADGAGGKWGAAIPDDAEWVGGATDGEFGAVGQDVRGLESTLRGRKSWFFLGPIIVCLGISLTSFDGELVETTYDNRNLGAASDSPFPLLVVDGVPQPSMVNSSMELLNASWAHLAGSGGYLFLDPRAVLAVREARTGRWSDIDDSGSSKPITRRYFTLYRTHGRDPFESAYAYAVLPGASENETRDAVGSVRVILNEPMMHAAAVGDVFAANFFAPGRFGPLRVSGPCSVLVRGSTVYVADPTQSADVIEVVWRYEKRTAIVRDKAGASVSVHFSSPLLDSLLRPANQKFFPIETVLGNLSVKTSRPSLNLTV
ncbi:lyase [Ophiocordyceps camponoti-floridani]|uniref:Lyase n=1 Tax=Ophiocordyceps camponoti-floridani TaxID=2030778 RepID=A0A8H4Q512_9HYPO|nr:lyase [Ophiocordyceps camponoti-floridani]